MKAFSNTTSMLSRFMRARQLSASLAEATADLNEKRNNFLISLTAIAVARSSAVSENLTKQYNEVKDSGGQLTMVEARDLTTDPGTRREARMFYGPLRSDDPPPPNGTIKCMAQVSGRRCQKTSQYTMFDDRDANATYHVCEIHVKFLQDKVGMSVHMTAQDCLALGNALRRSPEATSHGKKLAKRAPYLKQVSFCAPLSSW